MSKFVILSGPDRMSFFESLTSEVDATPMIGFLSRLHARGGNEPPTNPGVTFLVRDDKGNARKLSLVITSSKRIGARSGQTQDFTGSLWASSDEYRDFLGMGSLTPWVDFHGRYDFTTRNGSIETT